MIDNIKIENVIKFHDNTSNEDSEIGAGKAAVDVENLDSSKEFEGGEERE